MALVIALLFLLTLTGRHLQVFTWPPLDFLQESHQLAKDPDIQKLREAVVTISVTEQEDLNLLPSERRGTGFNIREDGLIVTNRHLVDDAGSVVVSFLSGESFRSEDWVVSSYADMALVSLEKAEGLPVVETEMAESPPLGGEVTVIGNPLGYARVVARGVVCDYYRSGEVTLMEIEAPIHPGSSGSPVFNDAGRVVGVIFAVAQNEQEEEIIRGLAVPLSYLEELLIIAE